MKLRVITNTLTICSDLLDGFQVPVPPGTFSKLSVVVILYLIYYHEMYPRFYVVSVSIVTVPVVIVVLVVEYSYSFLWMIFKER